MPDLQDFYIWLQLQGTQIAVLIPGCFVVWKRGGAQKKKKTTALNSISVERQPSVVSWMSEVEFTRQRR